MFFQFGVNHNTYFVVMFGFSCTGKKNRNLFLGRDCLPKKKKSKKEGKKGERKKKKKPSRVEEEDEEFMDLLVYGLALDWI